MIKAVDGKDKSLRELLAGTQYSIDYYQREYRWETKQVQELLDDLTFRFLGAYSPEHVRSEIAKYPAYFLGSIILSRKEAQNFIIDGQQRLTTITLLLIFLRNLQMDLELPAEPNVEPLILSTQFGQRSLNIGVDERKAMVEALFNRSPLPAVDDESTLGVIRSRYEDIENNFPEECRGPALPFFMDWLIERVQIVEISAYSDEDAYTIFETMNDRGLSLSPADMLKGLILSNIRDQQSRDRANQHWKQHVASLGAVGKDAENDFFRVWFRGRLGETVGKASDDYERLGPEFHRWLRERAPEVGLNHSEDYDRFANEDIPFFSAQYKRIRAAESGSDEILKTVHLNAFGAATVDTKFVLLAPLATSDSPSETTAKLALMADYLDIFVMRRLWASRNLTLPALKGTLVPLARTVRKMTAEEMAAHLLVDLLKAGHDNFDSAPPALVASNRSKIHRLLARLTDYIEAEAGTSGERFSGFMLTSGRNKFSIEHLLPNTYEFEKSKFENEADFLESRNKLGALVLLPHTFNASYQDMDWAEKFPKYSRPGHNLLAGSLTEATYENNPRLNNFLVETGVPMRSYDGTADVFGKTAIDERTEVYRQIAKIAWNPRRLLNGNFVSRERVRDRAVAAMEAAGAPIDGLLQND